MKKRQYPILSWIIAGYMKLCYVTSRKDFKGGEHIDRAIDMQEQKQQSVIFAIWHGRLAFPPLMTKRTHDSLVMVSKHKDGQLIADVCTWFGVDAVRGSTNRAKDSKKGAKDRGGAAVLLDAISKLKEGRNILITPDGPKGPRMRMKDGVFVMAKKTDALIIPVAFSTSMGKNFNSWDRFLLMLPFGKIAMRVLPPIKFSDEPLEEQRLRLEKQLIEITQEADHVCGRTKVDAGEPNNV